MLDQATPIDKAPEVVLGIIIGIILLALLVYLDIRFLRNDPRSLVRNHLAYLALAPVPILLFLDEFGWPAALFWIDLWLAIFVIASCFANWYWPRRWKREANAAKQD